MTAAQALGALLISLPFVVLFGAIAREEGVRAALGFYAFTAAVVSVICLGSFLLFGWS